MVIAGEASGDMLAAEVVREMRARFATAADAPFPPRFFGAGGPQLAAAGVELACDLTQHAVVGLVEVLRNYGRFRRLFDDLLQLARERQPELIICVDFGGFNRRFAHAVKELVRGARDGPFQNWRPRIVQYVSPQVWASRPGRAAKMAPDLDLLLTIFPFEKAWYAARLPQLRVEFVGHPLFDRHERAGEAADRNWPDTAANGGEETVLLLPGSRRGELNRHLPVLLDAWRIIHATRPAARAVMVLPNDSLAGLAREILGRHAGGGTPAASPTPTPAPALTIGGLAAALRTATVALASTGTVTMECAYFGVPTVALYRTSWSTYQIGKRIITVKYLAMPNLLADAVVYPEFIQDAATPANLAGAALEWLAHPEKRAATRERLREIMVNLGGPGANRRAAAAMVRLLGETAG